MTPSTHTFTVDGVLHHDRSTDSGGRPRCKCCRDVVPDGHIFMYRVELQEVAPGTRGLRREQPADWLSRVLYPLRGHDGARVRITVEVELPEGNAA